MDKRDVIAAELRRLADEVLHTPTPRHVHFSSQGQAHGADGAPDGLKVWTLVISEGEVEVTQVDTTATTELDEESEEA
ncbi:hypothetical protein LCGC14_2848260 [marine sediment metagenome]|uniref:Uncharacterized protein n=1 Tax=marine sediment metagenome TaxID=412755 RepID=A0A0F8Y9D3_9ZZZZ